MSTWIYSDIIHFRVLYDTPQIGIPVPFFQWFIGSPEAHHSCHYNYVYSDTASNDISKDKTNIRVSADSLMCLLVVCIYIRWFTIAGLALSLILIRVSCLVEIVYVELS
mgnify:CR=1 FL=1